MSWRPFKVGHLKWKKEQNVESRGCPYLLKDFKNKFFYRHNLNPLS
jgi:hypothetical protein